MTTVNTRQDAIKGALADPRKIGEAMTRWVAKEDSARGFYHNITYFEEGAAENERFPPFLRRIVGPPLRELPAFGKGRIQQDCMGAAINTMHQELRDLAMRTALFVSGHSDTDVNFIPLSGEFDQARRSVPETVTLTFKNEAQEVRTVTLDREFTQALVALGAASLQILGRDDLLVNDPNNAAGFDQFLIATRIIGKLKRRLAEQGVQAPELGLDVGKIQNAFIAQAQHFQDARVLVQMGFDLRCDPDIAAICDCDPRKIMIENPKDAACALFALGHFSDLPLDDPARTKSRDLSERLAQEHTSQQAASLLHEPDVSEMLMTLRQHFRADRKHILMDAVEALEQYRAPSFQQRFTQPQHKRLPPVAGF